MPTTLEGDLQVKGGRIAIVVSRFNDFITSHLLAAAIDTYRRHGGNPDTLTVVHVPGSFEIPITAQKLARSDAYAAVVCLGCVIRGATDHYDHVASGVTSGIAKVGLDTGKPVIFGIITADTIEQAIERAGTKQGNTGDKAMLAAIEMVNLFKAIG